MKKMDSGIRSKSGRVHEDALNKVLFSLSHAIASKTDHVQAIRNSLKSAIHFTDLLITRFDLHKRTFKFFPELCYLNNQDPDFNSILLQEFPMADGIQHVLMKSEHPAIFTVKELAKEGMIHLQFLEAKGIKSLAGMRIQHEGEMLGTILLLSKNEGAFSPEGLRVLESASHYFATAMLNIIYLEENQERVANIMAQERTRHKEAEKSLLLEFSSKMATARDRAGLSAVVKSYLKEIFHIKEYIITIPNEDNVTYSYFLHDLSTEAPKDAGFKVITSTAMPVEGSMTGAVLKSDEPVVFHIKDIVQHNMYYFPSRSFWEAAGAKSISGMKLSVANEVVGILWVQPDQINDDLLHGVCAQIAIALSNIQANEKIQRQLTRIEGYRSQLERENQYLQEQLKDTYNYEQIIGSNSGLRHVFQLVSIVAASNSTVLLLGETGTGKELIATAIHNTSPRRKNLMVKLNCATMPANLVESELFGHEKGSFTGAIDRRIGKFELANRGTLFLDEISEIPLDIQGKLLRAIQEKEIERVGGNTVIKTDVRIIAASNRDLKNDVESGKFRSDLFYRLNVFPITLPPLRERREDIPILASFFMHKYAQKTGKKVRSISTAVINHLMRYDWPGNVRELEHVIERTVLMTSDDEIIEVALPHSAKDKDSSDQEKHNSLKENERAYILSILKKTNGKIRGADGAAAILKIPPTTLHSKLKKLGLKVVRY